MVRAACADHRRGGEGALAAGDGWCGRGDLNPHELLPNGFSYQLRLSPPPERAFVVWTIPSPCPVAEI